MAIYRSIQTTFWTDAKVSDEFTPEDKYFYLYLFTNPHTNLCGCYEIGKKQVSWETGYSIDTIDRLIERFEKVHQVIRFSANTREILLINWHKYNWTKSEKFRKPLLKEIESIKCQEFKEYLMGAFEGEDTVSIGYQYPMDTTVTVTVTDTVSVTDKKEKLDYQEIVDMYNETCVSFPRLTKLSDSRKKAIKARLNTYTIEDFKRLFQMAQRSGFLKGNNNRNWSATFDWLIKDSNMAKVLDGNYEDKGSTGTERTDNHDLLKALERRYIESDYD